MTITGIHGALPPSWCWVTTCADSMPGFDTPAIPSARELSIGAQVTEVVGTVQGADLRDTAEVFLNDDQIGPMPPGDWEYLVAFYYWRLP